MSGDWTPNEGYGKKFERLAFALVRTRPPVEEPWSRRRIRHKNEWSDRIKELAGPLALSLLIAIPYMTENSSPLIILASLLIAALDISLTVWCYSDFEIRHGHCSGDIFLCLFDYIGEFPAYIAGWCWIMTLSSALAGVIRYLSSIMDSVTGRHFEELLKGSLGTFAPFGAPIDLVSIGVTTVPSILVSLGMEESGFLRCILFLLTLLTSGALFISALVSNQLFSAVQSTGPIIPDGNLYSKILFGAALSVLGFIGIYRINRPDNLTLTQHLNFEVVKKQSLSGCFILLISFLFYTVHSIVINKVQQVERLWDGDPPILFIQLDNGGWRLIIATLAIAALALAIFQFLVPLCIHITSMANEGLLYGKLRKNVDECSQPWSAITPLVFGGISGLQALLIDTQVLLALSASSFLVINICVCAGMLANRYQHRPFTRRIRQGHYRTRPRSQVQSTSSQEGNSERSRRESRRLLSVSFLKNSEQRSEDGETSAGLVKQFSIGGIEDSSVFSGASRSSGVSDLNSNANLIDDTVPAPIQPQESMDQSLGSGVSGYESDISERCQSEETDDTDIDAAVTEYHDHLRVDNQVEALPTPATARRVSLAVLSLIPCLLALSASMIRVPRGQITAISLFISSSLLIFLLLVVISRQPQKRTSSKHLFNDQIVPWVPASAIFLNILLLLEALDLAGSAFAFWFATGLIIYFSYGVTKSVAASQTLKEVFGTSKTANLRRGNFRNLNQSSVDSTTPVLLIDPSSTSMSNDAPPPDLEPYQNEPCVQIHHFNPQIA